jgi:hypothetical protein
LLKSLLSKHPTPNSQRPTPNFPHLVDRPQSNCHAIDMTIC